MWAHLNVYSNTFISLPKPIFYNGKKRIVIADYSQYLEPLPSDLAFERLTPLA